MYGIQLAAYETLVSGQTDLQTLAKLCPPFPVAMLDFSSVQGCVQPILARSSTSMTDVGIRLLSHVRSISHSSH
jgi:hypothetical protein